MDGGQGCNEPPTRGFPVRVLVVLRSLTNARAAISARLVGWGGRRLPKLLCHVGAERFVESVFYFRPRPAETGIGCDHRSIVGVGAVPQFDWYRLVAPLVVEVLPSVKLHEVVVPAAKPVRCRHRSGIRIALDHDVGQVLVLNHEFERALP